jgi:hypothetical protein
VEKTFSALECAFAALDLAAGLRSPAYWYLLQLGSPETVPAASGFPLPSASGPDRRASAEARVCLG